MREHFLAVMSWLKADTVLAGRVHNTLVVDTSGLPVRDTYVVLFGGPPDELDDDRLSSPQTMRSDAEYEYTARSVSVTADGALAVAERVASRLVGFQPLVAARSCEPMRLVRSFPVEVDSSVRPPLFFCDQDFLLRSSRAVLPPAIPPAFPGHLLIPGA